MGISLLCLNLVLHISPGGPAAESVSHGDGLGALITAILPDSTTSREDGATVREANGIQIVADSDVGHHELHALAQASSREVRVVARRQGARLVQAAQVVRGGAAEGRGHGGRVGQRGHAAVAAGIAAGQGGQAGRAAVDGGSHWLAVELGEVVPGIGGCERRAATQ